LDQNTNFESKLWLVAALLCALLSFVGIFNHAVWTPDEPRVAAISLEMSKSGDVVIPRLGAVPFVEKPPIYFAVAAFGLRLFGDALDPVGTIRLSSAVWGLGILLVTFRLALLLARIRATRAPKPSADVVPNREALTPLQSALLATVLLATTGSFIRNAHYIRVDIALAFFVAAAVWAFAEAYLGERKNLLYPAGAFLGGAFLAKGLIGVMFVGVAWLGLFIPWLLRRIRKATPGLYIAPHLASLALFVLVAGSWIALLRVHGGKELWDEWFWRNQFGRLEGTGGLGHSHGGEPFFYVKTVLTHTLPWTPMLLLWLWNTMRDWTRKVTPSTDRIFLLVWSLGALIILSISVTKRDVYVLPLIPAFALMSAEAFETALPRICRLFYAVWVGLCALALTALSLLPAIVPLLPSSALAKYPGAVAHWSIWNALTALGLVASLALLRRGRGLAPIRLVLISGLLFFATLTIAVPFQDQAKSMESGVREFAAAIGPDLRPRIAAYDFSETIRGLFYLYGDQWVPTLVDEARAKRILHGDDPDFDGIILSGNFSLPEWLDTPVVVRFERDPDKIKHKELLRWVEPGPS